MFTAAWNTAWEPGCKIGTHLENKATELWDLKASNSKGTINLKRRLIHSLQT